MFGTVPVRKATLRPYFGLGCEPYLTRIRDRDDPVALERLQTITNSRHISRVIPVSTFTIHHESHHNGATTVRLEGTRVRTSR